VIPDDGDATTVGRCGEEEKEEEEEDEEA